MAVLAPLDQEPLTNAELDYKLAQQLPVVEETPLRTTDQAAEEAESKSVDSCASLARLMNSRSESLADSIRRGGGGSTNV